MEFLLAQPRGFCAGVDRAIEIVDRALELFGPPVYVRHEIVHNRHVVDDLRSRGAIFIEDPTEAPAGSVLVFSAHGVSPAVKAAAENHDLRVIDATCPLVTKVHVETRRLARDDYEIVMVGHAGHVEVEGTMGQAPDRMHLVETVADVEKLDLRNSERVGCVTQTTLSVDDTRDILDALQERYPAIRLPRRDDICYATQNRQDAVKALAKNADLVIVIGAPASSNSNRLVEVARRLGARAYLVQDESEIDPAWLDDAEQIGITAGASAPEHLVQSVVARLCEIAPHAELHQQRGVDEGVAFQLPALLR